MARRGAPKSRREPRVIDVLVPARDHGTPVTPEERWDFLEQLIVDACVFAGLDPHAPLRRDVVMTTRKPRASR